MKSLSSRRYERRQNKVNTETHQRLQYVANKGSKYVKYVLLALCMNTTFFSIQRLVGPAQVDVLSLLVNLLGLLSVAATLFLIIFNHHRFSHIPFLVHHVVIFITMQSPTNSQLLDCSSSFKSRTVIQLDFEYERVSLKALIIDSINSHSLEGGAMEIRPPKRQGQMPCTSFRAGTNKDTVTLVLNERQCFYFLQVDSNVEKPAVCNQTRVTVHGHFLASFLLSSALLILYILKPRLYGLLKRWKRERAYKQEEKKRSIMMEEKLQSCSSFYSVQTTLACEPAEELFDMRHSAVAIHI